MTITLGSVTPSHCCSAASSLYDYSFWLSILPSILHTKFLSFSSIKFRISFPVVNNFSQKTHIICVFGKCRRCYLLSEGSTSIFDVFIWNQKHLSRITFSLKTTTQFLFSLNFYIIHAPMNKYISLCQYQCPRYPFFFVKCCLQTNRRFPSSIAQ